MYASRGVKFMNKKVSNFFNRINECGKRWEGILIILAVVLTVLIPVVPKIIEIFETKIFIKLSTITPVTYHNSQLPEGNSPRYSLTMNIPLIVANKGSSKQSIVSLRIKSLKPKFDISREVNLIVEPGIEYATGHDFQIRTDQPFEGTIDANLEALDSNNNVMYGIHFKINKNNN